jgi:hypothetical protein
MEEIKRERLIVAGATAVVVTRGDFYAQGTYAIFVLFLLVMLKPTFLLLFGA